MRPKLTGILVFGLVLCAFCLPGCAQVERLEGLNPDEPAALLRSDDLGRLQRHIDYEAGSVCYVGCAGAGTTRSCALSCLPLSETRLDETRGMP